MTSKEQQWKNYYDYYLDEAKRQGVSALSVLDEQWHDGRSTAECVLPYISPDSLVLEIACGIGRVSRFIAPHCKQLHCSDLLQQALKEAKNNLKDYDNVYFHLLNGYDLAGFERDSFDCVYSFTTFFHFDFELVVYYIREIQRVLKTGGVAIIEFKQWIGKEDLEQLLQKVEGQGGIKVYEAEVDKWRYVSQDLLRVVCDYFDLKIINDSLPEFTFQKGVSAD